MNQIIIFCNKSKLINREKFKIIFHRLYYILIIPSHVFRNILPLLEQGRYKKKKRKPESIIRNHKKEERAIQFLYIEIFLSLSPNIFILPRNFLYLHISHRFSPIGTLNESQSFLHRSQYIETRFLDNFIYELYRCSSSFSRGELVREPEFFN